MMTRESALARGARLRAMMPANARRAHGRTWSGSSSSSARRRRRLLIALHLPLASARTGASWQAITSLNLPVVTLHLRARNKGFILNHPIPIPLDAYFDAFDGEGTLPELPNVRYVNLTEVQPWAHNYIAANMSRGSTTQQAYSINGSSTGYRFKECWSTAPASVPMKQWPTGPQKASSCRGPNCRRTDGWCNDMILIFKVAAFYDAVTRTAARRLLWLDSDAFFQRAPDDVFTNWMDHYDVATIFRFWPQYCPRIASIRG